MMKKFSVIAVFLLAVLSAAGLPHVSTFAEETRGCEIVVESDKDEAQPGETVNISVVLQPGAHISAITVDLLYDTEYFEYQGDACAGGSLGSGLPDINAKNEGKIVFSFMTSGSMFNGSDQTVLLTASFKVLKPNGAFTVLPRTVGADDAVCTDVTGECEAHEKTIGSGSGKPAVPVKPSKPERPSKPDKPAKPDRPDGTSEPAKPDKPVAPPKPAEPDKPDGPGQAIESGRPDGSNNQPKSDRPTSAGLTSNAKGTDKYTISVKSDKETAQPGETVKISMVLEPAAHISALTVDLLYDSEYFEYQNDACVGASLGSGMSDINAKEDKIVFSFITSDSMFRQSDQTELMTASFKVLKPNGTFALLPETVGADDADCTDVTEKCVVKDKKMGGGKPAVTVKPAERAHAEEGSDSGENHSGKAVLWLLLAAFVIAACILGFRLFSVRSRKAHHIS